MTGPLLDSLVTNQPSLTNTLLVGSKLSSDSKSHPEISAPPDLSRNLFTNEYCSPVHLSPPTTREEGNVPISNLKTSCDSSKCHVDITEINCCDNTKTEACCYNTQNNTCCNDTSPSICCEDITPLKYRDDITDLECCEDITTELCCDNTPNNLCCENINYNNTCCDNTHIVTSNIQKEIDHCTTILLQPWEAKLLMTDILFKLEDISPIHLDYISKYYQFDHQEPIDIMLCTQINSMVPPFLYFDKDKYDTTNGFEGKGYKSLIIKLSESTDNSGFIVVSNGLTQRSTFDPCRDEPTKTLRCRNGRLYNGDINELQLKSFRDTSITNDRFLNNRGILGKKMPRRRQVFRPTNKEMVCSFSLTISFNSKGFYIANGYGNNMHCYHPKTRYIQTSVCKKTLNSFEHKLSHDIIQSSGNSGICRNLLFKQKKKIYSLHNIYYINQKIQNSNDSGLTDQDATADKILKYFHDNRFQYYCLCHDGSPESLYDNGGGIITEDNPYYNNNISNTSRILPRFIDQCSDKEKKEIQRYVRQKRSSMQVPDIQILLMSIAWVTPFEKRLFNLFPEVLYCDVICGTNNENRPLFTVTGKDSSGKMFTFFRAFLPNQKQWSFRWLFNVVFPQVFTGSILSRVNCIITDGDTQQINQLDTALTKYFPNAVRVRCGWYVCNRTFDRHGPRIENYVSPHAFDLILSNCMGFVYSWMKPSCETKIQYMTSKYLFWRYLHSTFVRNTVGENFVAIVTSLVRNYIEVVEDHFVFYKRKKLRNFDAYSNSCHEGTNNSIKHTVGGTKGSNLLDVSSKKLTFMAEMKYTQSRIKFEQQNISTKVWNPMYCAQYLTVLAGNLLLAQLQIKDNFHSIRSSNNEWKVKLYKHSDKKNPHKIIPDYVNVRTVTVKKNILYCDCYFFNRIGILCRHLLHVLYKDQNYPGPSHHDISVRWWSIYSDKGHCDNIQDENDSKISKLLAELHENDTKGPTINISNYTEEISETIDPMWNIKPEDILMRNFELSDDIKQKILSQCDVFGLSQSSEQDFDIDILEENEVQLAIETQFQEHFDNFLVSEYIDIPKPKKKKIKSLRKKMINHIIVCILISRI